VSIVQFTVHHDQFGAVPDTSDVDANAELVALIGTVVFSAQFSDSRSIMAREYSPRPAAFKITNFYGYMDSDARLHANKDGALGVRLPANDPVFGLANLEYRVDWDLRTPGGQPVPIDHGYFTAPTTDLTLWLADVLLTTSSGSDSLPAPTPPPAVVDGGFPDSVYNGSLNGGNA
jgi:hypothetical protein